MKKILVIVEDYPNQNSHSLMYVHVRNKYYIENGIDVEVLNFNSEKCYNYEGIKVITLKEYQKKKEKYHILISHASNLKNHYGFISKYSKNFKKIIYFYHGHEILKISDEYPKEYPWVKKKAPVFLRNIYDEIKFILWRKKIEKNLHKSHLIFVSNWLYHRFLYNIHIKPKKLNKKISIINNSVGQIFEEKKYDKNKTKKYDFITIRGGALDGSKYGIDIVTKLAILNPKQSFLVIGKGKFYEYIQKPSNITFINKTLNHQEMIDYINMSKCALLPTKEDTQGVMTCEMFTYGIPTITSDIEVCREIFDGVENVELIDNDNLKNVNLKQILKKLENKNAKINEKYFKKNTIQKELNLINKILEENNE